MRRETIKVPEENIDDKLLDRGLSDDFLDLTPKVEPRKVKISKWDYIKLEHICIAKEITNKMKRLTKEKNMFKNIFAKDLIYPDYKNSFN